MNEYQNCDIEAITKLTNISRQNNSSWIYFTHYYTNTISSLFKNNQSQTTVKASDLYDENGYVIANPDADPAKVRYIIRSKEPNSFTTNEKNENGHDDYLCYLIRQRKKVIAEKIQRNKLMVAAISLAILVILVIIVTLSLGLAVPRKSFCIEKEIEYEGGYLDEESNVGLDECQNLCLDHEKCRAFTYRFSDGNTQSFCWMKQLVLKKRSRKGVISGSLDCSNNR